MLFKRGSTISAAEGGCQAEVGVACSMASAGFAACMGGMPSCHFLLKHYLTLYLQPPRKLFYRFANFTLSLNDISDVDDVKRLQKLESVKLFAHANVEQNLMFVI